MSTGIEKKMKLTQMKHWYCLGGENPEDHKFIRMKVVTMLTWVAENENDVGEMEMQWSMGKKMMKEEMENSNVVTCQFWQSLWLRDKGRQRKEGTTKPLHHTCKACHNHPKDVELTCNTHGETHDKLLGLRGGNHLQQMKPSLSLLNTSSSWMMRLMDNNTTQMNSMLSIWKKRQKIPTRNKLIDENMMKKGMTI